MPSFYLNQYVERLVVRFLRQQGLAWIPYEQIHKGFEQPIEGDLEGGVSMAQKKTPMIEVICAQSNPRLPEFVGNWDVLMEVIVTNSTRTTDDVTHEQRVNEVLGLFFDTALQTNLLFFEPNFWYHDFIPGPMTSKIVGISFVSSAQFTFLSACAQSMFIDPPGPPLSDSESAVEPASSLPN